MAKARTSNPVECELCGKVISRKADLARHMKTHVLNKKDFMFGCPYLGCTYETLQRSNLATHLNVHSRKRPHKCPAEGCDFNTSDPGSLTRHRKDVHGYEPKANSRSHTSAIARKAARQRRRKSPYTTSSSPSGSGSSASPTDSSADTYQTPRLQIHQAPDQSTSSVLLADAPAQEGNKSNYAAYSTDLTTTLLVNDSTSINHQQGNSPRLTSGSLVSSEAPTVEYPPLPMPEQRNLHATDLPGQPASETTSDDTAFDDFLAQFGDWATEVPSTHTAASLTPVVRHAVSHPPMPPPLTLPVSVAQYSVNLSMPTPIYPPSYEYAVDDTPHDHRTEGVSLDAQLSPFCSFAAPDMGFYPQTYFYPAPAATNLLHTQGFSFY